MPKKIIKSSGSQNKVQTYSFKTFAEAERGVKSYSFKELSETKVEKKESAESNAQKDKNINGAPVIDEKLLKETEKIAYEKGFNEGFTKGKQEGIAQQNSKYEAEKQDYLNQLANSYKKAIEEISQIKRSIEELDENLPNIIISFVNEIVGAERKINDKIIESLLKNILEKLRQYSEVKLLVAPEDKEIVENLNLGYDVETEPSLTKGDLKVQTNIGLIDFTIDSLISDFKEKIYEEFKGS